MADPKRTGGCQCGAIRYEITGTPGRTVACHCADCQQQSGSAFGMTLIVGENDFHLTKGALKSFTAPTASGRTKQGAFCPDCGTRIYHLIEARKGMVSLKPGTLDDTSGLKPDLHIWTAQKQPWIVIPDDAEVHEKQPF
ncbi:MAG: GFA family protein [Hyphomicrobiales bacterium]|nr:GFA family protein [Hyphomicrobiales bacterium]